MRREEAALLAAHRWLICDTTPLTTRFYAEEMFGDVAPRLAQLSRRHYPVTFLCVPDFPFAQDGTRRDASFRDRGHAFCLRELAGAPHSELRGALADRVREARGILER